MIYISQPLAKRINWIFGDLLTSTMTRIQGEYQVTKMTLTRRGMAMVITPETTLVDLGRMINHYNQPDGENHDI